MPDLLIRDLDESTKQTLKARAASHGRSLAAEARAILQREAAQPEPPPAKGWGTIMMENATAFTDEDRAAFRAVFDERRSEVQAPPPFSE